MEDIIEKNKVIAEFTGSKYINEPFEANKEDTELTDVYHWTKPENGYPKDMCVKPPIGMSTAFMIGNFFYHSSWDWLMPLVEKIESISLNEWAGFSVRIERKYCLIKGHERNKHLKFYKQ